MDYNLPGSPVQRISQARIMEWVALPFSRSSSQPRDQTSAYCMDMQIFFTAEPPGKPRYLVYKSSKMAMILMSSVLNMRIL